VHFLNDRLIEVILLDPSPLNHGRDLEVFGAGEVQDLYVASHSESLLDSGSLTKKRAATS
jgi:hypothetical protein